MKNYIAIIIFLFALTISATSYRENKEVSNDDADDVIENTIQEGVNEVHENTDTVGTEGN